MKNNTKYEELCENGFCVFEDILSVELLAELRKVSDALVDAMTDDERTRLRYQGSSIPLKFETPAFRKLITWEKSLDALKSMGFDAPKFWSGYILSKNPGAPALYWHQDWPWWDEPISAQAEPTQIFLMYYLTDTTRENGCLRVIPGTHYRRIAFHDELPAAHSDATYTADENSILFARHPDEVEVRVNAGDMVIGDARVLHAAYANRTAERRTCLTLWYYPRYDAMPESLKASVRCQPIPPSLPEDERKALEAVFPVYEGNAERCGWNRNPGVHLKPAQPTLHSATD